MGTSEDAVIVAQGDLGYLRELRRMLDGEGIESRAIRPPEGRGST